MFHSPPIRTYGIERTPEEIRKEERRENIYLLIQAVCLCLGIMCLGIILICYFFIKINII